MIKITNDTSTLNGALSELGEKLATNLFQKGVEASATDGLTTLANKILNIESIYNLQMYDNAVQGDINNGAFSYATQYISLSTDEYGTTVTNNSSSGRVYSAIVPGASYTDWNAPFKVDFDLVGSNNSGTVRVQILQSSSQYVTRTISELGATSHITYTYDGATANYYADGSTTPAYTVNKTLTNPLQIRFYLPANTKFKYKNYRVYQRATL